MVIKMMLLLPRCCPCLWQGGQAPNKLLHNFLRRLFHSAVDHLEGKEAGQHLLV